MPSTVASLAGRMTADLRAVVGDGDTIPIGCEHTDVEELFDLLRRPAWQAEAACRGRGDVSVFFPGRGQDVQQAKAVCAGCPVREQCADYGQSTYETRGFGVWGGTSASERKRQRRYRP